MRLRSLTEAWNRFFFEPRSPIPISLFRIIYGVLIIADLILLYPSWLAWFGTRAWITLSTMRMVEPGTRINLFVVMPQNDYWIGGFFWFFLAFATLLTIGLFTRISSVAVFISLVSIHQRNLYINHGGDTFIRVAGFFLMFAPAGAAFSIDRLIRIRRGKETAEIKLRAPWAQRMIQIQLSLMYFMSFWWKSTGAPWVNGTAFYYVSHLTELQRFPIPHWLDQPWLKKLGSWFTLLVEFSLGTLIWIKELRYPVLLIGVLFHMSIEYALNIPLFEWEILSAYILFVDPADIERAIAWSRRRLHLAAAVRS